MTQLTFAQRLIAYCQEKNYKIAQGAGEKNIIYVEGMYPDGKLNDDAPNVWNDARLVIEFKKDLPEIVGAWEATTEPGKYYTQKPLNVAGAARIAFGQYQAWQIGNLGQKEPQVALIQTGGAVKVYRDLNQDGLRIGDRLETGFFGINQTGASDAPSNDIGIWSAGSLVGRTRDGHQQFIRLCKQDPRYLKNNQYIFQTTVIAGDDLFKRYPPTIATSQLNQAILSAATTLRGMSTADGPDGGNNACAWSINRVLQQAGIAPLGENPNYVPSLVDALKSDRGQPINRSDAKAGDLVVAYEEAHIGIGLDNLCATVLSNSSSRARFSWESDTDFDNYYGGESTIYRLLK